VCVCVCECGSKCKNTSPNKPPTAKASIMLSKAVLMICLFFFFFFCCCLLRGGGVCFVFFLSASFGVSAFAVRASACTCGVFLNTGSRKIMNTGRMLVINAARSVLVHTSRGTIATHTHTRTHTHKSSAVPKILFLAFFFCWRCLLSVCRWIVGYRQNCIFIFSNFHFQNYMAFCYY